MVNERVEQGSIATQDAMLSGEERGLSLPRRTLRWLHLSRARVPTVNRDATLRRVGHSFSVIKATFVAFVAVPSLLASGYFVFVAASQFTAETRFVVRQGSQDGGLASAQNVSSMITAAIGAGSRSVGGGSAAEDAHIVVSYIRSRAIVADIDRAISLREMYTRVEADKLSRLRDRATIDELFEYWKSMVRAHVESTSGVVTVEVRAFRPDDAVQIARAVQELSERLVNAIATRARQDALRRAEDEVRRAQGIVLEALHNIEVVRNEEGLVDPVLSATENGKVLSRILIEKLAAESQLSVGRNSLSSDSPTIRQLQSRVDNLTRQAADLRAQMAGGAEGQKNIAGSVSRYEHALMEQKVAETFYGIAEAALDRARQAAEAQSVFLAVFVPPASPEDYSYPRRFTFSFLFAVSCLTLWSIAALIWSSVEDHRLG